MAKEGVIEMLLNPFVIIISLIILFTIILIILIITEIRLKRKIKELSYERDNSEITELKKLLSSKQPLKEKLDSIDKIAKSFLNKNYDISQNINYSDMVDDFKRINKPEISQFCDLMVSIYYSGKEINEERINALAKILLGIIRKTNSEHMSNQLPQEVAENQNLSLINQKNSENKHEKPLPSFPYHKSKFEIYLEVASDNRREVEKISEELKSNNKLVELSNKSTKKEEIKKMISDNPKEFSELKRTERLIKKKHLALNTLIKRVYADLPYAHKKKLGCLAKEWYEENQKIFIKANNPFKQYLQELDLLKDFFIKIGLIITKTGIISKE